MGGHGGKLFMKSVQILTIFSLLIDEKRRKKTNYPKITDVQTRFHRCQRPYSFSQRITTNRRARAPLTTNIRLATKWNYRNAVASYRNFYKQFCFFTDLRPVLILIDDSVFSPVIFTDISQFYPRWPQKFETIFTWHRQEKDITIGLHTVSHLKDSA